MNNRIPRMSALVVASVVAVGSFVFLATQARAAVDEPPEAAPPCVLKIATGTPNKGYSKLFADIKSVCGSVVPICEVHTEGGLQNLTTLASNQADLGFVQVDTLAAMKASDESIGALLAVMSVNDNLLHIVTRSEGYTVEGERRLGGLMEGEKKQVAITRLADLKGLPVALVGSAQQLGREIDREQHLGLQPIDVDTDEQALALVRNGKAAALLSTSGWPSGPIGALRRDSGFTLMSYDKSAQPPYALVHKNYPNMGIFDNAFLAVPNLLVTRAFKASGPNGRNVAALQRCIVANLAQLQEGRYEPAWSEVKNPRETAGWPRFVAAGAR